METEEGPVRRFREVAKFVTFLTGMETFTPKPEAYDNSDQFVTFLTGMETIFLFLSSLLLLLVRDLPNRDGNFRQATPRPTSHSVRDLPNRDGNYSSLDIICLTELVRDLPNRDGNTRITTELILQAPVRDLPNRDGNKMLSYGLGHIVQRSS